MPDRTDIYALIREYRALVLKNDNDAARDHIDAYKGVWARIRTLLDSLTQQIDDARANGEDVSLGWLFRQDRYKSLIEQSEAAIGDWCEVVSGRITAQQATAVVLAQSHAQELAQAQLPFGEQSARVAVAWNLLPHSAVSHLIGAMGDGTPLAKRFEQLAPQGVDAIRTALIQGVAIGKGSREIARDVRDAASIPLDSALRISRTETLRDYREASRESYQANDSIIDSWIWVCSFSARTCPACLAMNGTEHPLSEPMASHVNCRCTMVPKLDLTDASPVVRDAEEWLKRQSAETQEAILGKAGAKAWRDGTVTLKDFAGVKHSDTWGSSVYVRSFKGAVAAAEARTSRSVASGMREAAPEIPPPSDHPPIPASIKDAEQVIGSQSYETAHAWSKDGSYLFGRNGSENKIRFDDDELAMVKDSIFLHNHPSGNTLSRQDVRFLTDYDPLEMRIATAKKTFVLTRPATGWPENAWESYEAAFRIEAGRNRKDYESGKIGEKLLDLRTYRDAMKRFVKELGLDYREEAL